MSSDNHGQTPAAWAAVVIITIGFLVGGIAIVLAQPWLFWVGSGVIVIGGLAGWILRAMGLGQDVSATHSGGR